MSLRCLTVDFQGWTPVGCDGEVDALRSRARRITRHGRPGSQFSGYSIGSEPVLVRLYNKTAEIDLSGKPWFREVWRRRSYDRDAPVWRLEALRAPATENVRRDLPAACLRANVPRITPNGL